MRFLVVRPLAALFLAFTVSACAQPGWDPSAEQRARDTITAFKAANPNLDTFFNQAEGYAVFPTVGKGAAGLGAAYGEGTVFEKGRAIGLSSVTKIDLGLQLGGQTYRQIVFFKDQAALDGFKAGNFTLAADASAVAVAGAKAAADYSGNVAVFTLSKGGLMFEAAVGGQKFSFEPK
jgi:lipid-binding SYLF domain-containing protein